MLVALRMTAFSTEMLPERGQILVPKESDSAKL
jgi:hypothetical protein